MQLLKMSSWIRLVAALATASLLSGCLGGSGGSSSKDDAGVPPLPEAVGTVLSDRYQPLGKSAAVVLDIKTDLAWKRCYYGQTWDADLKGCEGVAVPLNWSAAYSLIDEGGFRLPSLEELQSLVYCNNLHNSAEQIGELDIREGCGSPTLSPTIEPTVFPDMRQLTVWTSENDPSSASTRLGINFSTGVISDFNSPQASYRLILVRDPEDGDDPRAADGSLPPQSQQQ